MTDNFDEINFSFSKLVLGNPFDIEHKQTEDLVDDHPKLNFSGIKMLENSPVLCTAGLNFIKTAGDYLELMGLFTPISFEVFHSLTQLFEFFVKDI